LINDLRQGVPVHGDPADGRRHAERRGRSALSTGAGEPSDRPTTRAPIDWRQFGHELRTPLHAILGNVELLLDGTAGPLSTEARKCVGEIQTASRQLLRQVRTLLLWAELHAGEASSDSATLDVLPLLRDVRAVARAAPLAIEPADASLVVRGDRFWLRTLFGEILELGGARNAPAIRLESRADGRSLDFSWRQSAGEAGPLQVALIEAIAHIQGAVAALTSNGLSLYWPAARLPGRDGASNAPGRAIEADRKGAAQGPRTRPRLG
jgi:His Kinase A (phospho-acceptor) domain